VKGEKIIAQGEIEVGDRDREEQGFSKISLELAQKR
jgi:hypothetical protein